jgi:cysteinyl-tRNA synthetase
LADGQEWVGWWLHGDFINLKGAKISKSSGGGVLVDDLVDRGYHPLVYRYLLLQAHYRSQVVWAALDPAAVRTINVMVVSSGPGPGGRGEVRCSAVAMFGGASP